MTSVSIVGSTGSIGTQTIEVVDASPDRYEVVALGAHSSVDLVVEQARRLRPSIVAMSDPDAATRVAALLDGSVEVVGGSDALAAISSVADVVVNGVVGFAGLPVTLGALAAGRRLALANKESLIAAGPVVAPYRRTPGAEILPVDSEHCAIHQCLRSASGRGGDGDDPGSVVAALVLTASGGPFRGRSAAELESVTVAEALKHPTWSMGPKITVDSSTLMNKGLEVIEARELFGVDVDDIDVVVHPTSIVHSMVTFTDGATIAQLSEPDMRLPIGYALAYPDRGEVAFGSMDFSRPFDLHFEPPDHVAFPCLGLAYEAARAGQTAPAWLSAANEVSVEAFLAGRIGWSDIARINAESLNRWDAEEATDVDAILEADARARATASAVVAEMESHQ
jgi:1-deoxy-D-xylulose-5-phosphate reductoisomerase